MKRLQFYTLVRNEDANGIQAALKDGWTDGKFNYYKNKIDDIWYAVIPKVGYAASSAPTKSEVIAKANNPKILKAIERLYQSGEMDIWERQFLMHIKRLKGGEEDV